MPANDVLLVPLPCIPALLGLGHLTSWRPRLRGLHPRRYEMPSACDSVNILGIYIYIYIYCGSGTGGPSCALLDISWALLDQSGRHLGRCKWPRCRLKGAPKDPKWTSRGVWGSKHDFFKKYPLDLKRQSSKDVVQGCKTCTSMIRILCTAWPGSTCVLQNY